MLVQPYTSFADNFSHIAYDVTDLRLPDDQRLSALLGVWDLIKMSLENAGTTLPMGHYFKQAAREKPASALSLVFRTQTAAITNAMTGRNYFECRRLELEKQEFCLPAIRADIPVARLCSAIPAVPELRAMAHFARTRDLPEIATLLESRARSDVKGHLGLG